MSPITILTGVLSVKSSAQSDRDRQYYHTRSYNAIESSSEQAFVRLQIYADGSQPMPSAYRLSAFFAQ